MLNLIVIRTNQLKTLMEFYQCFELKFDYHQHGKGVMHYSCEMNNGIVFEIYTHSYELTYSSGAYQD